MCYLFSEYHFLPIFNDSINIFKCIVSIVAHISVDFTTYKQFSQIARNFVKKNSETDQFSTIYDFLPNNFLKIKILR